MASLRALAHFQDSTHLSYLGKGSKVPHYYGCPVEVQSPRCLTLEEKTALVQEMEEEFLNMRKVFISGFPPDSIMEVIR